MLSGGGTGGHVYPVFAIVEQLRSDPRASHRFLYLGNQESIESELCERERIPFRAISAGALRGMSPFARLANSAKLGIGVVQSLRAIASFRPDAALVTGGYVSVPPVIASWMRHCPVLIYLPDLEPGLAIRTTARLAKRVAVSFPEAGEHFAEKAQVTGYPVRRALHTVSRQGARERLGLALEAPVLLVMGGSRGAQTINRAAAAQLGPLLDLADIIHISGHWDITWLKEQREKLAPERRRRYHLYAYLHEGMADAMAAADLVVARAGAATLAEFPAVGLPSILAPYPYSGQHQEKNADYLVQRGAAIKVADSLLPHRITPLVRDLLNDRERLEQMKRSARELARPDAAANIANLLAELAEEAGGPAKEE